jgi:hypothetical protein
MNPILFIMQDEVKARRQMICLSKGGITNEAGTGCWGLRSMTLLPPPHTGMYLN